MALKVVDRVCFTFTHVSFYTELIKYKLCEGSVINSSCNIIICGHLLFWQLILELCEKLAWKIFQSIDSVLQQDIHRKYSERQLLIFFSYRISRFPAVPVTQNVRLYAVFKMVSQFNYIMSLSGIQTWQLRYEIKDFWFNIRDQYNTFSVTLDSVLWLFLFAFF